MNSYELIIIIRQDISPNEVEKITSSCVSIIEKYDGSLVKTEYWGIRNLAYEIVKSKKAHYSFVGFKGKAEALNEIRRRMKINETVLRTIITKVKEIDTNPSAILKPNSERNTA
ncbi:MAG TPA: 30S ribosomal protein S6 [Candidatus Megaira endosymbiont of Hartmannula sinica]|nr:30S ribosomal protein S6 [Candidatus Megaera endosymbiont of Hartmannula sinica]